MKMLELLDSLRRHPEFTNEKSLKALRAFLSGYEAAVGEFHINDAAVFSDLRPFSEWVAKHYGYEKAGARSWYSLIAGHTQSDAEAFDMFFDLLSQYRQRPHGHPVVPLDRG
jgi:hypothetical protein